MDGVAGATDGVRGDAGPAPGAVGDEVTNGEQLSRAYLADYRNLVQLARFLLRDPADGEDVVQHVYVHLLSSGRRPHDAEKVGAYLRRCVVNETRAFRRRHAMAGRRTRLARDGGRGDRAAYDVFERQAMLAALRQLPRRQREAVVLRYYADLTVQQAAAAMGTTAGGVKSNCSRAMSRLAELIKEEP